ncbi:helix-turn-helix domain-containing protein, partial [Ferrimonas gelatinilytica]|uniref:helix-turn-helix domain-containing protein n=1 Tax=Ferrimonas gelatinilytica TaxID=1255257 RepID=UPI0031ED8C87
MREQLVRRYLNGEPVSRLARQFGLSESWIYRLLRAFKSRGDEAFAIGSSRPRQSPNALALGTCFSIQVLAAGGWPQWRIAEVLNVSEATVSRVLVRMLGKRWKSRREPVLRYEHDEPGSLVHLDIKRVAQFDEPGWRVTGDRSIKTKDAGHQYVHVCVDDHSRVAHAEQLEDQRGLTAAGFM